MSTIEVHGTVAPGFEAVRAEYAEVVAQENGESGSQLAAFAHGRPVVDLWSGAQVTGETLTGLLSSTKGAAALVVALLVQDGMLDLDRPVAAYWPEFADGGKVTITLRQVLTNKFGAIGVDGGFSHAELADDQLIAERIAGQRPFFRPGVLQGYGGFVTFAILGEVVRRLMGSSIQELFEERVRAPYDLDIYLGLPAALDDRYLPILPWLATPETQAAFEANSPGPQSLPGISYNLNAPGFTADDVLALPNDSRLRANGPASMGGVGSARGLAGMYAAAISEIDGRAPLLKPDTLAVFTTVQTAGHDLVRGANAPYLVGFEAKGLRLPFLGANAFGHAGAAGSDGFADPHSGLAYGYTRRRAAFGFNGPENDRLAAALHRAIRDSQG
ncbi:CubicO group peptidase (beta-lactamase class C family) [Nocardia tenerifensis]|uniref:CubicO group peptidase (Beta-lactamase class C family) n=1 Tax=Nocardia tenerifensis TaxID=228006 RepID=A0A318JZ74_9NOCA|nr:EstA family serine hydrolase [Nocardia tenerifensis]PXX64042.1 CubicO group peptidase (beta-lactamase class C family) [Nocardia tenerifensis]